MAPRDWYGAAEKWAGGALRRRVGIIFSAVVYLRLHTSPTMASTGAGIDIPGEWFLGSVNTTSLVLGKTRALVIDNATTPPTVTVNGSAVDTVSQYYGSGADGTVIAATGTLTKDMYYDNLTVNNNIVLSTGGFRIFVKGTLTLAGTGRISGDGGVGADGGAGGTATGGSIGIGVAGGAGGAAGAAGTVGTSSNPGAGSAGGAGGSGLAGAQAGGAAGAVTQPAAANGGTVIFYDTALAIRGRDLANNLVTGGAGGGGGGGGTGKVGGGGGSGGRVVVIAAATVTGSGTITAAGGAGGAGLNHATESAGGGGGGGGGSVVLLYKTLNGFSASQLSAAGGAGGAAGGTGGVAGSAGTAGTTYAIRV